MKTRIITSILIIVYSLGLQALLLDLFPNPGPATMGTVPLTFLISFTLGVLNFFLFKKIIGGIKRTVYFLMLFIGLGVFSINFYPQEEPFKQISLAYYLYKNPEKIKYEHLFKFNYQIEAIYVTAALIKFRDSIPEQAFRISYCCKPQKEFFIAKYGNTYKTNNDHLIIDKISKRDTIIFKDVFNGENIEFNAPQHIFGNLSDWGYYINSDTKENMIHYYKCELKPLEGFNRIYYEFLK